MCLGIPAKIASLEPEDGILMGKIDFGGIRRQVCLELVPQAKLGDYVIVHAGFAISLLDEAEAQKTFDLIDELERAEWAAASAEQSPPESLSLLPRRREGLGREVRAVFPDVEIVSESLGSPQQEGQLASLADFHPQPLPPLASLQEQGASSNHP